LAHGSCPYCDIILKETGSPRVIWEDEHIFALSPYASEEPYAVWLIPKRHFKSILDLNTHEKRSIATALKIVLNKLDELGISYNYFIENWKKCSDAKCTTLIKHLNSRDGWYATSNRPYCPRHSCVKNGCKNKIKDNHKCAGHQ
jgi:galactose-1-phosphate uridylyltransferase